MTRSLTSLCTMIMRTAIMALATLPGGAFAADDNAALPPLKYEQPETILKTPQNGSSLSVTIPTGGDLYVTPRPGLQFRVSQAKLPPTLSLSSSQNNLAFHHTGNLAANGSIVLHLADGRKVTIKLNSQNSGKTATYLILN